MSFGNYLSTCSLGHEEVCYIGNECPVCTAIEEITKEKDDQIESLKKDVENYKNEVTRLTNEKEGQDGTAGN